MMRVIGVLFHRRGELLHAGRRLFNRRRLLLGTGREIGVTRGDLAGSTVDLLRPLPHGAHGCHQRVLHRLQIARQAANFAASGRFVRHGQIAFCDIFDTRSGSLERVYHRTAQHHKGDHRQRQRKAKRAEHKHQPQPGAGVSLCRQRVGAFGADFYRLQQHRVIGIVQRTRGLIFVVNNGFKHAIFGIFQHRLHTGDVGVIAGFQIAIQRFISRGTNGALHIGGKSILRLPDADLSLSDVLFHRLHLRDTARRPRVDHVDTGGA